MKSLTYISLIIICIAIFAVTHEAQYQYDQEECAVLMPYFTIGVNKNGMFCENGTCRKVEHPNYIENCEE